ncbi:OCIA domain-containing protein 1-like isoform X2 [Antedon mediterranea]
MAYSGSGETNSAGYPPVNQSRGRRGEKVQNINLTPGDLEIVAECRRESFYYRSLPLSTLAAIGTHQLIRMGYLTTGRLGQIPKIGFAMLTGYLVGKISYVNECKKKFMRLENSEVGEMLRKGKNIGPGTFAGVPNIAMETEEYDERESERNAIRSSDPHVNLDIDTSTLPSLDDKMDRPETLYQFDNDLNESQAAKPMTTYEELRKRNRDQSNRNTMQNNFDNKQLVASDRSGSKPRSKHFEDTGFSKSVKTKVNTYGDSWDE